MFKKLIMGAGVFSLFLALVTMPIIVSERQAMAANPGPAKLEVFVPTGTTDIKPVQLAKRVDTLAGKRIALHWNLKPGGEYLLAEVEAQLKAQYKDAKIFNWPTGITGTWWTTSDINGFMKEQPADVVILAVGD